MPRARISRQGLVIIIVVVTVVSLTFLKPGSSVPLYSDLISFESPPDVAPEIFDVLEPHPLDTNPLAANPIHQDDLIEPPPIDVSPPPPVAPGPHRENATLFVLTNNWEIDGAAQVVRELEERFNHKFNYPWVFLNDQPFTEDFITRLSSLVSGPVHFGQISDELWNHPPWINSTKAAERMEQMEKDGVAKSGMMSYHNMCRFNSGTFHQHPLLQKFRYYWRVEPEAHYHCNVDSDPFTYLRETNKVYGFTLTMPENPNTIETLWSTVKDFIVEHPQYIVRNSAMDFVSDNGGIDYNLCQFFNNFEIADMDFWRGEAYTAFFDYLDHQGGFYYERWGDAPVHTIAAALLAGTDRIHFFREIGYEHYPFTHCPVGEQWERGRCSCEQEKNFDYAEGWSCVPRWDKVEGRLHGHQ